VAVLLGNGDGSFQQPATYDLGGAANSVAVADVDRDGRPDLVVAMVGANGHIGVLLGNGDGTFQSAKTYPSGGADAYPDTYAIAVADMNDDGRPDLVVTTISRNGDGTVGVLLGNGDGTFQPVRPFPTGGASGAGVPAVAVADVNGDGKPDVLAATLKWSGSSNQGHSVGAVAVLWGNGDGTLQPAVIYPSGAVYSSSLAVSDVSGDGKPDIVVENLQCCGSTDGVVSVLLGNGDGTFQPAVIYRSGAGGSGSSIAVADVNRDGNLDIVATDECAGSDCFNQGVVGVLLGNGDGTFQAAQTYSSAGFLPKSVAVADLNEDGASDIVVANFCGNNRGTCERSSLAILLNNNLKDMPTTTSSMSSLNPSFVGQAVTFTATVASSAGIPSNGEIITFYNGTAVLGTARLSAGAAMLTTSALSAGVFTVSASYPGDATFAASKSAGLRQTVHATTKSATATTFASSLNTSIYGQRVSFTAHVTTSGPVQPTGTVVFMWRYFTRTYAVGTATLNSAGVATLTKSNLNSDSYPMTAIYRGDINNLSSTSPMVNQTVLQATSATALTSSLNPSMVGQAITLTAKITSPTVTPSGPVIFKAGTTVLGTAQIVPWSHKATLAISTLPVGSTVIRVVYVGDTNIAKSSAVLTQVVQ
jgi:hypothetical protein